jgi:hypothetical protein
MVERNKKNGRIFDREDCRRTPKTYSYMMRIKAYGSFSIQRLSGSTIPNDKPI